MEKFKSRQLEEGEEVPLDAENSVDREFRDLETEFTFQERMDIARGLFEELDDLDSNLRREAEFKGTIQYKEADGQNSLRHFFLPDIPGGEGDITQIREGYDRRAAYLKAGRYIFIRIGQGEMWVVPKQENPYLKISMSECSVVVGQDNDKIIVAHISYSALNEIGSVISFMRQNGISPDQIFVAASIGKFQDEQSKEAFVKRASSREAYLKYGIPEENIMGFEYDPGELVSDGERISHNVTQVLVSNSGLFKWSFDLKQTFRTGSMSPRENMVGEYKDEELREFALEHA